MTDDQLELEVQRGPIPQSNLMPPPPKRMCFQLHELSNNDIALLDAARVIVKDEFGRESVRSQTRDRSRTEELQQRCYVIVASMMPWTRPMTADSSIVGYVGLRLAPNGNSFGQRGLMGRPGSKLGSGSGSGMDAIIHTLTVVPEVRGQKAGSVAITQLLKIIQDDFEVGFVKLGAVYRRNYQPRLVKFYEKLGFSVAEGEGEVSKTRHAMSASFATRRDKNFASHVINTVCRTKSQFRTCAIILCSLSQVGQSLIKLVATVLRRLPPCLISGNKSKGATEVLLLMIRNQAEKQFG